MIQKKLNAIEEKILKSSNMKEENKKELLVLINELKSEFNQVDPQESDKLATLESMNKIETEEDEGLIKSAFNDITDSLQEFESNHPKLMQVLNAISTQLSNSGL